MPNFHLIRQVLLGIVTLFLLMCLFSCRPQGNTSVIFHNTTPSSWLLTIESQKSYASLGLLEEKGGWKKWANKSFVTLDSQSLAELPLTPGAYNWYAILPYKVIRGGSFHIPKGVSSLTIDSSQVFFDYRKQVSGAYHLNCTLKKLNEQRMRIQDSSFSYVVNVSSSEASFESIQIENRAFLLSPELKFDYRSGPIDLVTGRFLPHKEELRMKVTTKEQITPFRTCNCVGKKIEVYETEPNLKSLAE